MEKCVYKGEVLYAWACYIHVDQSFLISVSATKFYEFSLSDYSIINRWPKAHEYFFHISYPSRFHIELDYLCTYSSIARFS